MLAKTNVQIQPPKEEEDEVGRRRPPMPHSDEQPEHYWFARHSKSIIFLIFVLTIVGVYEALSLPVAVFPDDQLSRASSSASTTA